MPPIISVIIAARNEQDRIGRAIISALKQTLLDSEIVVIDDNSTDETVRTVQLYADVDHRVRLITSNRNLGRADARNLGIDCARADLIAILDADDLMMPDRLEKQVSFMARNPQVGMIGAEAYYLLDSGEIRRAKVPLDNNTIRNRLNSGIMAFVHPTMVFRRTEFLTAGGYQSITPHFNEDFFLCYQMMQLTRAASIPEPLIVFSTSGLTSSQKLRAKYEEMSSLQFSLLRDQPGGNMFFTMLTRRLVARLPAPLVRLLTQSRLLHLPRCSQQEIDRVMGWMSDISNHRSHIEGSL